MQVVPRARSIEQRNNDIEKHTITAIASSTYNTRSNRCRSGQKGRMRMAAAATVVVRRNRQGCGVSRILFQVFAKTIASGSSSVASTGAPAPEIPRHATSRWTLPTGERR